MFRLMAFLLLAATAQAAVLDGNLVARGTLASAQAGTGASTNSVKLGVGSRYRALVIQYVAPSAASTVQVEQSCDGTNFFLVPNSSLSTTTTVPAGIQINEPACEYRTNATACTSCALTTSYFLIPGQP